MKHKLQPVAKATYQTASLNVIYFDNQDLITTSGEPVVNVTDVGTTLDWVNENKFN